jgi:hypothetical protein
MNELAVAFEEVDIFTLGNNEVVKEEYDAPYETTSYSVDSKPVTTKEIFRAHKYFAKDGAMPRSKNFYTLRVCKECRGDWMKSIETWFHNVSDKESCGSGIFIRRNGRNVEVTPEEWKALNPGREPVRYKP